jgi:hypothetical protein
MRISVSTLSPQIKQKLLALHAPHLRVHTREFSCAIVKAATDARLRPTERHARTHGGDRIRPVRRLTALGGTHVSNDGSDAPVGLARPREHTRTVNPYIAHHTCVSIHVHAAMPWVQLTLHTPRNAEESGLRDPARGLDSREASWPSLKGGAVKRERQTSILKIGFRSSDRSSPWVVI